MHDVFLFSSRIRNPAKGNDNVVFDEQVTQVQNSSLTVADMGADVGGIIEEKKDFQDNAPEPNDRANSFTEMTYGDEVKEADGDRYDYGDDFETEIVAGDRYVS